MTTKQIVAALRGAVAASNESMTEFISKKRAAGWGVINEGLMAAESAIRDLTREALNGDK